VPLPLPRVVVVVPSEAGERRLLAEQKNEGSRKARLTRTIIPTKIELLQFYVFCVSSFVQSELSAFVVKPLKVPIDVRE